MDVTHTDDMPYDPSQVKVELKPFTIFQVMRKIRLDEINLQPDFQRHMVWDETRQSRLIESILMRIPLPAFYLDAATINQWMVVDGLQRLSTLERFCNHNDLALSNLEFLTEFEGFTFDELPREYQRTLEETHLNLYIIQPDVPDEVKFTIFYRINTGGVSLTKQEIRHCLYHGQATKLLQELARAEKFKIATHYAINPKHMDDRECILRFLAFHLHPYTTYQRSNFDNFLGQAMRTLNELPSDRVDQIRNTFFDVMHKATALFGDHAFRKLYDLNGNRQPINKNLFEVWSVALIPYDKNALMTRRDSLLEGFIRLMNTDDNFNKAISRSTTSVKSVHYRFAAIEALLKKVMAS